MARSISQPGTDFLRAAVQDYRSRIAQVEYQGQTLHTRILECKLLIDTSCCIRHRLELKFFT